MNARATTGGDPQPFYERPTVLTATARSSAVVIGVDIPPLVISLR